MYAVLTWHVADVPNAPAVREAAEHSLDGRESCVIHGDVRIATVSGGTDFLRLVVALEGIGTTNPDAFTFSAHLLRRNAALRTNADVDPVCVDTVVEH